MPAENTEVVFMIFIIEVINVLNNLTDPQIILRIIQGLQIINRQQSQAQTRDTSSRRLPRLPSLYEPDFPRVRMGDTRTPLEAQRDYLRAEIASSNVRINNIMNDRHESRIIRARSPWTNSRLENLEFERELDLSRRRRERLREILAEIARARNGTNQEERN